MFVGVAKFVLHIPEAASLKERRRVVKSFKDRLRSRFGVSVAEIGDLEKYQVAEIGVSVVSNEAAQCDEVMSHVATLANTLPNAVLAEVRTEVLSFGKGGRQLPQSWLEARSGQGQASLDGWDDLPWGPDAADATGREKAP